MSESKSPVETRLLIVDPDENFGKALKAAFQSVGGKGDVMTPAPVWASSLRECQRYLSDRDYAYMGVFINPKIGHPSWVACVKSTHQYRPGIPCFVIFDDVPKLTADQIKQMGVQGFIPLPLLYADLNLYVGGQKHPLKTPTEDPKESAKSLAKDTPKDLTKEKKPASPPAAAQTAVAASTPKAPAIQEKDLIAIDIKDRVGRSNTLFDVYIKLSDGKFVQILKVGDPLTQDRLDKYKEHGAEHLFIPRIQNRQYLEFCDQVVSQFLKDDKVPLEKKMTEILRYGAESLDFLKDAGFQTPNLERAEKFVSRVTEGILQTATNSPSVKEFMQNAAALEHSVGVATISGLLLKHIGVIKPETYQSVGMASVLHDVGLFELPAECWDEDEFRMSEANKILFREHPMRGAKKLASDPHPPPKGVIKAIEQHHLRINGGFPTVKGVMDLSPIAEIVGISEEFCRLLKRAREDKALNPFEKIKEIAHRDFSPVIGAGLIATLKEK